MFNSNSMNNNVVLIEPDTFYKSKGNQTTIARNGNSKQTTYDQLLKTCLNTINHQMHTSLVFIFQTIETLENLSPESTTREQQEALLALRCQAKMLDQLSDGLRYIADFPANK